MVPLETRKPSIVDNSFFAFWKYEFTCEHIFHRLLTCWELKYNQKISLGVSVAYFSSIAELAILASGDSTVVTTGSTTYFDSVVYLTMFLLIGTEGHTAFICNEVLTSI